MLALTCTSPTLSLQPEVPWNQKYTPTVLFPVTLSSSAWSSIDLAREGHIPLTPCHQLSRFLNLQQMKMGEGRNCHPGRKLRKGDGFDESRLPIPGPSPGSATGGSASFSPWPESSDQGWQLLSRTLGWSQKEHMGTETFQWVCQALLDRWCVGGRCS